jgi:uncharacterized RDD family membrane protein YckC
MDTKIDFSSYNLEELHDAAQSIDRDMHPERAEEVARLIQQRTVENAEEADNVEVISNVEEVDNIKRVGGKATKMDRLFAALIDGLISIIGMLPIFFFIDFDALAEPSASLTAVLFVYGFIMTLLLHGYLLYYYGQTIGKNFMSIRIENLDSSKASLKTIYFKRMLPMQVLSIIPFGGQFISGIVNPLFIFGKQRRCLHDYLAKTQVSYTNN